MSETGADSVIWKRETILNIKSPSSSDQEMLHNLICCLNNGSIKVSHEAFFFFILFQNDDLDHRLL